MAIGFALKAIALAFIASAAVAIALGVLFHRPCSWAAKKMIQWIGVKK